MRKLLPRAEYKLLKNRKCARLSRCKRKEQTLSLIEENKRLMSENAWLRSQLGMSPAVSNSYQLTLSENENDSGGAESYHEESAHHCINDTEKDKIFANSNPNPTCK